MRIEGLIVFVIGAALLLPGTAMAEGEGTIAYEYVIGPSSIEMKEAITYNESMSNSIREMIDTWFGNGDGSVNQSEVDQYLEWWGESEVTAGMTIDGLSPSGNESTTTMENAVGPVNSTTPITENQNSTFTYDTSEAEEHTIVIANVSGDEVTPGVSVTWSTIEGWYFTSVSGDNGAFEITNGGRNIKVDLNAMANVHGDITIVISTSQPSDDGDASPGFEAVAIAGALGVALIVVRRRR